MTKCCETDACDASYGKTKKHESAILKASSALIITALTELIWVLMFNEKCKNCTSRETKSGEVFSRVP